MGRWLPGPLCVYVVFFCARYMFLCDDWLAVNKSDGSIRRTLKPSNAFTAANNASSLVRSNMFHKAVDDHMWLSTVTCGC